MMSGSNGGDWVTPSGDSCATLSQVTTLNSPNRNALRRINPGDVLPVEVADVGKTFVVQVVHNGEIAGTITSSIIQKLAECVQNGYRYVAEVLENHGGACKVRVKVRE